MAKNNHNDPCDCGHSYINHAIPQFHVTKDVIDALNACAVARCNCTVFKMDNLKYLEKQDDARKQ